MYSGGWAFSNSRKSVKYPPHDPHTSGSTKAPCFKAVLFGILQKPNKSKSSQKRTKPGLHAGSGQSQSRQLPAVYFCQCCGLAFDPRFNRTKGGVFVVLLSRPHSRSAASPRQRTQRQHTPAFRPAASRPHDPASITRNTTTICTKTTPFICAIFQSKNTCISGYCVVQYRQLREGTQKQAFPKVKKQ